MKFIGKSDLFLILKNLGLIMIGVGIVISLPIIAALVFKEHNYVLSYILPSLFSIFFGLLLKNWFDSEEKLQTKHAMIISALAWLWATFIGSLVMMMYLNLPFIDAFFENMSAWTTTGLTIFPDVEILPRSILFLRSIEQWFGGLGIVILVIGVLIKSGTSASRLYESEARNERIRPSIVNTVKTIWLIYITLTLVGIVLYGLAGMPIFDSVNHSMTALATGGMSIKNASIGFYKNVYIDLISILLMFIGSVSFLIHYQITTGQIKDALKNKALQGIIFFILGFSIINSFLTRIPFIESMFYMTSAITSTGFGVIPTETFQNFPQITILLIIILMIVGAGEGSTAGAIKINKIIKMFKGIHSHILKISLPENAIFKDKVNGKNIKNEEIKKATIYVCLYLVLLCIGICAMTVYTNNLTFSLFEVISAQGNVGLSIGLTQKSLGAIPKLILIFHMWAGRIEIVPVILLLKVVSEYFNNLKKTMLSKD